MTIAPNTDRARPLVLQRDGACLREVVARRHGRRRNPARRPPRSLLRTPINQPPHSPQRWVRKIGRSITKSKTPHVLSRNVPYDELGEEFFYRRDAEASERYRRRLVHQLEHPGHKVTLEPLPEAA